MPSPIVETFRLPEDELFRGRTRNQNKASHGAINVIQSNIR